MADQYGNLSPEDYAQQQAINRQQRMAEMLMQNTQQPQGQMVGNRYVAPSFFQNIAPLVNQYQGQRLGEQADIKAAQLAEAIRQREGEETQKILGLQFGSPDYKPAQMPQIQRDDMGNVMPAVQNQIGQAPNQDQALIEALKARGRTGQMIGQTLLAQKLKPAEEFNLGEGEKRFRKGPNGETIQIASGGGKAHVVGNSLIVDGKEVFKGEEKPVQIDTGTAIQFVNPKDGKVIFSTPKHHVFAPQAPIIKETDDGLVAINPYTLKPTPIMGANNQPLMGNKPLNDAQGNATAFGMRMIESNKIINDLAKKDVNFPSYVTGLSDVPVIGGALGSVVNQLPSSVGGVPMPGQSPEQQSLLQAKRNFITAVLRKESGASISPTEFKTEELKYFPQRGDSQLVIDQKADARKLAIEAMKIQAGPGAKNIVERKPTNTGEIPIGVSKELWAVMTPEEKAAFK